MNQEQGNPSGTLQPPHSLLCIQGFVNGQPISILHDDSISHDFISERLMHKLQLHTSPSSYKVKSTFQGTCYNGTCEVKHLEIRIGPYKETRDFLIAPLHSTDLILGMPFRHQYNPKMDYNTHSMHFVHKGKSISLTSDTSFEIFPLSTYT